MFNDTPAQKNRSAIGCQNTNTRQSYEETINERKEGNVLFNDALNTFYLRLYGVGHMVKDHSDSEKWKLAAAT